MIKKHWPLATLGLILLIAAVLRLYRIGDYMSFLGDEGRDALIVKRMIVDHEFTLLGPITSVGLMHLGPIYYYFMAPFLMISHLDPVGPAIMVALFSLATIILMWKLSTEFFNLKTAAIASLMYALSPLVIIHSRSSWNPNILPFWSLLIIYSLMKVYVKNDYKWIVVAGLAFGVAIQLHYVALVFLPISIIVLWLARRKLNTRHYLTGILGWLISFSPFILFELRHKFINSSTVWRFITRPEDSERARTFGELTTFVFRFWDLTVRLFYRLVVIENYWLSVLLMIITLVVLIYFIKKPTTEKEQKKSLIILLVWYSVGVFLLSLYTGAVFDYYLMFAFCWPFLVVGFLFSQLSKQTIGQIGVLLALVILTYFQFKSSPTHKEPNRIVTQTKDIADFILGHIGDQPYNFALIAPGNSDHAYRYFLEVAGSPPVIIENPDNDPDRKTVTDQLFVVCEDEYCSPLGYPLWEIAGFGRAEIDKEWKVGLFTVYKLRHYVADS